MRILICPDKFKGTLSAQAAAQAIAEGWLKRRPSDRVELLPISDGGDGFGSLLAAVLGAEERHVDTVDAAHRPLRAPWWFAKSLSAAIVESAQVIGIALLPRGRYHPFELDTEGLGRLLVAIINQNCSNQIIIGLGGSATNDAAFGAARSYGWQFLSYEGHQILNWTDLACLKEIIPPPQGLPLVNIKIAVDVTNPLLGPNGATRVYGPQKGLRPADILVAEAALERLVEVVEQTPGLPHGLHLAPGSGAAGGLGYGLQVFFGGTILSGFDLYCELTGLAFRLKNADLVITGEGTLDETSLSMGKGTGRLAKLSAQYRVPCIALVGTNLMGSQYGCGPFQRVYSLVPEMTTIEDAMQQPGFWLTKLAEHAAAEYGQSQ